MINALLVAMELNSMLPDETPANTEGYEGFFHLADMSGNVERAEMDYIIRDHSEAIMTARKATLAHAVKILNEKYGSGTVECTVRDQYLNMVEKSVPVCTLSTTQLKLQNPSGLCPKLHPSAAEPMEQGSALWGFPVRISAPAILPATDRMNM